MPAFSSAPLVAGLGSIPQPPIPSRSLASWGGGRRRRRMGRDWGCKRAAAPRLRDPRLRSRNGSQASNQAPGTSACARARARPQSRLVAACPALRRLVSRSRLPAPTPVAPRFTHPTLRLQSPLPSVPRTLDIPCPLNPVSGYPTFCAPRARKTPHPVFPRLGYPTFDPPRLGDPICSAPSTSGTLTSDSTLLTMPSVLALHVFAHCLWHQR